MNDEVRMIPLDQIRILNHRHRDAKRFAMIVQSIKNQGLKKPIKVSELEADEGEGPTYDLSGLRQIEIAEVMVSANNFTKAYAEALVLATPKDQMLSPQEPKKKAGMTAEELSRMEREMEALEKDFKSIEANYSENMMSLTLGRGYIKRLLENNRVLRHLREHHGELLTEFETIATAESV